MADTIISNTPSSRDDSSMTGWFIAVFIILAVTLGFFVMYQNGLFLSDSNTAGDTNINVTIPDPVTPPVTVEQ